MRGLRRPVVVLHAAYFLAITANPFRFGEPSRMGHISWHSSPTDLAANFILLVPFALALRTSGLSRSKTVVVAAVLSLSTELLQLFNTRATSVFDVLLNTMGVAAVVALPNLTKPILRTGLAVTPALWSVGLLWPQWPSAWVAATGLGFTSGWAIAAAMERLDRASPPSAQRTGSATQATPQTGTARRTTPTTTTTPTPTTPTPTPTTPTTTPTTTTSTPTTTTTMTASRTPPSITRRPFVITVLTTSIWLGISAAPIAAHRAMAVVYLAGAVSLAMASYATWRASARSRAIGNGRRLSAALMMAVIMTTLLHPLPSILEQAAVWRGHLAILLVFTVGGAIVWLWPRDPIEA